MAQPSSTISNSAHSQCSRDAQRIGVSFKGHPKRDVMMFAGAREAGLDSFDHSQALEYVLRLDTLLMEVTHEEQVQYATQTQPLFD